MNKFEFGSVVLICVVILAILAALWSLEFFKPCHVKTCVDAKVELCK
jgi:hypothetical protein